jgi:hypothetical protein
MVSDAWVVAQSVATILATAFALPMIYLTARQLRLAAEAYKAASEATSGSALGAVSAASRELQWKVIENKSLHPILVPSIGPSGLADSDKQELVRGMLISNYAFIYELKRLGQVPQSVWPAMKVEMVEFFRYGPNIKRWEKLRELYGSDFREFIDTDIRGRPH